MCEKYGIDPTDPEERRKALAKKEAEKRKKANGDKDGPPNKKQKKETEKGMS
jgi:hypothetical protein